jgi:6-phosphogluconolactonase
MTNTVSTQRRRVAENPRDFLKNSAPLRLCVKILCFVFVTCIELVSAQRSTDYLVYIGSYTNTTAKGIYVSEFDSKTGALLAPRLVAESVSPAQVWVSPNGRFLYAANWQGSTDPVPANTISAYAIDGRTGGLTFINKVSSGGLGPNQVVVDPTGRVAVAVNYRSGSVAAFGIEKDGRISDAFYVDQHEGQPQPPSKQPGPRAHGVAFPSDSRYAYVADIGLDRVYSYRLDAAKRTMAPLDPPYIVQPAGSGPRRLQVHPNGKVLYLARETDSHVAVFAVDDGRLKEIHSLPTLPADHTGGNTTAEILIDSPGKFLYVSNRGHGSIAVYAIDRTGRLTLVEHAPSGGRIPRNFSLDPTGKYLFSSNQDTENIVVLRIDRVTGRLIPTGVQMPLANPGSIAFVRK